ncbi:hypothetical protein EVAR_95836_1 [Eumeta japonica]|uniref:Uncharacterized protein n=1 Tax=Eumeta variegata TaxID=151549 RepID=A0A4C1VNN5_EUMVA|nr:hypothetical protein EVAR_95836_1 [Eumeta japonica]
MRAVRRSCARVSIKSRKSPPRPPARRRRRPARRPRPNAIYKGRPALGGRNRLTETQEKGHTWRIIMCELLEPALATFNYALTDISGLVSFSDCDWLRIEKIMTMMGYWNISSINVPRKMVRCAHRRFREYDVIDERLPRAKMDRSNVFRDKLQSDSSSSRRTAVIVLTHHCCRRTLPGNSICKLDSPL